MEIEPILPDAIYTVAEAVRVTKLGENTLRKLAACGEIEAIRVGSKVLRFKGSKLIAYFERGGSAGPVNIIPDQVQRRPRRVA